MHRDAPERRTGNGQRATGNSQLPVGGRQSGGQSSTVPASSRSFMVWLAAAPLRNRTPTPSSPLPKLASQEGGACLTFAFRMHVCMSLLAACMHRVRNTPTLLVCHRLFCLFRACADARASYRTALTPSVRISIEARLRQHRRPGSGCSSSDKRRQDVNNDRFSPRPRARTANTQSKSPSRHVHRDSQPLPD